MQSSNNIYTVAQVNRYVKNMFAQDFFLRRIWVKGEVSNCKYHTSGHIYFSLKDESGTISCVMFAGQRRGLAFRMKEGDRVVVTQYDGLSITLKASASLKKLLNLKEIEEDKK